MPSSTNDRIVRVGIAGLGRSGWSIHVTTLEQLPEHYRIVAVCDLDPARRAEAEARLGCRSYVEFEELVRDREVDLIVVAGPSHLHARHATAALRAGKDVLVEKPFATSLREAEGVVAVARETGRLLSGSQDQRYAADFFKVREVIESGKLGRILTIRIAWHWFRRRWDWQTVRELGGGSLNNDGSHAIDQVLLLLPEGTPEVFCHMETTPLSAGDAEDHVKIILRIPGGPLADLEFSNANAYPQEPWLVMGTQGGLARPEPERRQRQ